MNFIKTLFLFGLAFFLYAFAAERNSSRQIQEVQLNFTNSENLYVTEEAVNNLLIQNNVKPKRVEKEVLDLNKVEMLLNSHAMIEKAEVFMSVDGNLGAFITQRKPIARIMEPVPYYIDRKGMKMPLSRYYSARVPVVHGVSEQQLEELFPLVTFLKNDEFLSRNITAIQRLPEGGYELQVRKLDMKVFFGEITNIERKFNNFKAFYQKAMKDKKLNIYKKVNLRFGDQVVCTKK